MVMILVPANPSRNFEGGPSVGSIEAHVDHLHRVGKVFWRLVPPGRIWKSKIKYSPPQGYFLSTSRSGERLVTYRFEIERMFNVSLEPEDYLERMNLLQYVPEFREYHINDGWLILITQISPLDVPRRKEEFRKHSDKKPVIRVYNLV